MSAESAQALEVLREIWHRTGQLPDGLDEGDAKSCRRMTDAGVGFDDFGADAGPDAGPGAGPGAGTDPVAAWRARLAREGKLGSGGSVRDLVLGPEDSR